MKRRTLKTLRYMTIVLIALAIGLVTMKAVTVDAQTDAELEQIDAFIEEHQTESHEELETVKLSYAEWKEQNGTINNPADTDDRGTADSTFCDYQPEPVAQDVWSLGLQYGISELDTTRALKIISYEGYGYSPLSYYVACCCWVRATEGYWGYANLYQAFGEADTSYDEWMDGLEIADWAYDALIQCYSAPTYVRYCNGMCVPDGWVYEEDGIYVW